MLLHSMKKLLIGLSVFACTSAFATPLTLDVRGIQSYGVRGEPLNPVFTFDVGANAAIISVTYNVNLTASFPSYLSEISLGFTNSAGFGTALTPAFGDDFSGTGSYSGMIDLVAQQLNVSVGADGILRVEFYEGFDDDDVSPDGTWNFGTVTFYFAGDTVDPGTGVPEPASALLIGAGLAMMGYAGRRRRQGARAVA